MSVNVGFNIGGQVYLTTVYTLRKSDRDSILYKLSEDSDTAAKDAQGNFFFDRDGVLFRHILNYLRTDRFSSLPEECRDLIREEASFYGMKKLEKTLETNMAFKKRRTEDKEVKKKQPTEYVRLYRRGTHCQYTMYGLERVLYSIVEFSSFERKVFGSTCGRNQFDQMNRKVGDEKYIEFPEGYHWSCITEILTKNGFTCKAVSHGGESSSASLHGSEIWLFEKSYKDN